MNPIHSFLSQARAFFWMLFFALPLVALSFSFDDIPFRAGTGSHQTAIVLDWNLPSTPSRAWVFQWETPTTLLDALRALDHEDPRLHLFFSPSALSAAGYDLRDSNCYFHFQDLGQDNTLLAASDPHALIAGNDATSYWLARSTPASPSFTPSSLSHSLNFTSSVLEDKAWIVLQFLPRPPLPASPEPAFSPYAVEVVDSSIETNPSFNRYSHLHCVLGAPTRMCPASSWSPEGPISPLCPAATTNDLVTLYPLKDDNKKYIPGTGSITVRFDHPVLDDPANPWGLDFLVFGNAFKHYGNNLSVKANADPNTLIIDAHNSKIMSEPGLVEVSQDGLTWYSFPEGPFADDWTPTLGYVYNPDAPDPTLFAGNNWWSIPTDATRPTDPALTPESTMGLSLAEVARRYEGSAGGTGFDIASLPLPTNETGHKWIQFVRITSLSDQNNWTEVDALSDVAPCGAYERYLQTHIPLTQRVDGTEIAPTSLAPNGRTHLENAALGLAPNESSPATLHIQHFSISNHTATFSVPGSPYIQDILRIRAFQDLSKPHLALPLLPHFQGLSSDGLNLFTLPLDESTPSCFYQLLLQP